jgi:hypothetical protein
MIEEAHHYYFRCLSVFNTYKTRVNYDYYKPFTIAEFKKLVVGEYQKFRKYLGDFCIAERIMYSEPYEMCGMTDKLIVHDKQRIIDFGDHKTNNFFKFASEYRSVFKPPFSNREVCEYNTYSFQLNIYANMLEDELRDKGVTDYKFGHFWVSYWDKSKQTFQRIELERRKEEAEAMRSIYRDTLLKTLDGMYKRNMLDGINENYHKYLAGQTLKMIEKYKLDDTFLGKSKEEVRDYYIGYYQEFQNKQINY